MFTITTDAIKQHIKRKHNITVHRNNKITGMKLGNILYDFVKTHCPANQTNQCYKELYNYMKNTLPKTSYGEGHARRYLYDTASIPRHIHTWYTCYYPDWACTHDIHTSHPSPWLPK